jgi:beta-barrel assembly-enhancing protease
VSGRRAAVAWLLVALLLPAACAGCRVTPIGADGTRFTPDDDERALWAQAEKDEAALGAKAKAYGDPQLEEYLARIGDRLTPDEMRAAGGPRFTFDVIRDPTLNAFAMPNGRIYVHTGLLSRLDNEAQLATIVAHEMTHVTHRHALALQRAARSEGIPSSRAAVIGPTASVILGLGLPVAALASMRGYGRALERDADSAGMENLVRAGYDPKEAPKAFALLRSESSDRDSLETFFFGSPTRLTERIESTQRLLDTTYANAAAAPTTATDSEAFRLRMRSVVRENASEDIRAGRFLLARRQLDRVLAVAPADPIAYTYYGDLHRLQSQQARDGAAKSEQARLALAAYEKAVALDATLPEPHRQLAFLYYQQNDNAGARAAFQKYLELKPGAPDARRIREYVVELERAR